MSENFQIPRRTFLAGTAATIALSQGSVAAPPESIPIIDTHIHLFDPNRPQGAPYRGPNNSPVHTKGAFPDQYQALLGKHGIVGAIEVEASPWIEDNLWVLELCAKHDIMVGTVGNLRPEVAEFPEYLERYHKNPLFRGIRHGNLWRYDIVAQSRNAAYLANLKLLAQADLVLDTANPRVDLLEALVRINDAVPDLRIVIDHLPKLEPKPEERGAYDAVLREIAKRPNINCKVSAVIHPVDGKVSTSLADHKERIDLLMGTFGEDRVVFGSDWPNNEGDTPVDNVVRIMKEYFADKPRAAAEKYFWRNSVAIYKWVRRTQAQRALA